MKNPPRREGFVETMGIDVPNKDGGCSGSLCIFRIFFRL